MELYCQRYHDYSTYSFSEVLGTRYFVVLLLLVALGSLGHYRLVNWKNAADDLITMNGRCCSLLNSPFPHARSERTQAEKCNSKT